MEKRLPIEDWCNNDNQVNFYNKAPIKHILQSNASKGGLKNCCDVASFYSQIKETKSLLDVGAAYGRVLNYLLKHEYPGTIDAIEKSALLYEELKSFSQNINIHHTDILSFKGHSYDVILSMWSGISDFSKEEQPRFIEQLASLLNPNGTLYLDTFICDQKPLNANVSHQQSYVITEDSCTAKGYIPSAKEIKAYCQQANLTKEHQYTYITDIGRERVIYVIKHANQIV